MRPTAALVLLCLLVACGGGGGSASGAGAPGEGDADGPAGGGPGGPAGPSHADRVAALDAAAARLADLDVTTSLPATGTATYAGHLGATLAPSGGAPVFVAADVTLTARFGAGTLSGTFDRASAADGTVSGSGAFTDGRIGTTGIDAGVAGTLVVGGAEHAVGGRLRGAFLGPGAEGLVGAVEAGLSQGGAASGRFDGEVWAER